MSRNISSFSNGVRNDGGTLTIRNSIIDDGSHCTGGSVTVTNSYLRNDELGDACPRTYSPADGALNLGALTGSPAYFPLLAGSLAIDAGHPDYCPPTDQAGNPRPFPTGGACDIGAFELQTVSPQQEAVEPMATATETPSPEATSAPLQAPDNLRASVGADGITLRWDAPDGQVNGYEILRRRPRQGEEQLEAINLIFGDATTFTDSTATTAGELYVYGVKALSNDGRVSEPSEAVNVEPSAEDLADETPTATSTPIPTATNTAIPASAKRISSVTLVSNQPGILDVSWNAPAAAPDDYRISWARVGEGFPYYANPGHAWPTSPSYRITDLDQGVRYKIRVRARYDGAGGDWSEPVEALVMAEPAATNTQIPTATNTPLPTATHTPIPAATNTAIPESAKRISSVALLSDQPGLLVVSWSAPAAAPDDYRISWAKVGEGFPYHANPGNAWPTSPSYRITDLDQGVRYKIRVRACYDGGGGDWSEPVDAEVMAASAATNTSVPTNTAVPPTNTPVPTNTAVPPTNTPVPTNTAVPPTNTPVPTNTTVPPTNTPVPTNTAVPPTNTPVPTDTTVPPPSKPRNLRAGALANGIKLKWDAPSGPVDAYEILRRRPRLGEDGFQTFVADTGSSATKFTDTTATQSTRYVYRVKAIRNGVKSEPSNIARVDR